MGGRVGSKLPDLSVARAFTFTHDGRRYAAFQAELPRRTPLDRLSQSEREVVVLVLEGLSDEGVALATGRARRTVSNLLARACRKLGVRGRADLAALLAGQRASP
jgi:DNA-binding CsgD family transcriptional regulator